MENYGKRKNDYQPPAANENGGELKIRKILESEAARYVAFITFFIPVVIFLFGIKQDIALIKQNHLTHIENIEVELKEQKQEIIDLKKQDIAQRDQIIILQQQSLVILEKITNQQTQINRQ